MCLYFWGLEYIPDQVGSINIIIFLDCMTGFGLGESSGLKEITPYQFSRWSFGKFIVQFGLPKTIAVDADLLFADIFNNDFQETLLITVYAVARGHHKSVRNVFFHL